MVLHPYSSIILPSPSLSSPTCTHARTRPLSAFSIFSPLPLLTSPPRNPHTCARRLPPSNMADISKPRPGIGKRGPEFGSDKGGGVAVITKPDTKRETKKKAKTEREPSWRVLLHNDDVHTFDYVTGAIVKVVRTVSRKKAHRITMQAHASGVATVTTTWKAQAEEYCKGLQMQGLTSSIAPDSSFTH